MHYFSKVGGRVILGSLQDPRNVLFFWLAALIVEQMILNNSVLQNDRIMIVDDQRMILGGKKCIAFHLKLVELVSDAVVVVVDFVAIIVDSTAALNKTGLFIADCVNELKADVPYIVETFE